MPQQVVARLEDGRDSKHKLAVLEALGLVNSAVPAIRDDLAVVPAPEAPSYSGQIGRQRDVPELGIAVGGSDGDFSLNGETIDYVPRPPALLHRKMFAVRVKNDSMEPRFEEGDVLYIDVQREPRPGEYVVIEFAPTAESYPGRALVKRLVSKATGIVIVDQFNPPGRLTFKRDEVKALYRVIPQNEMLGM